MFVCLDLIIILSLCQTLKWLVSNIFYHLCFKIRLQITDVNQFNYIVFVSGGRGGRKLDDVRDKYQKACRKLHLTHNEYVLLLCEAVEFEKDFRTVLLPGLLEYQQSLQEAFISTW